MFVFMQKQYSKNFAFLILKILEMLKIACFLQNIQTLQVNNSRILAIRNSKSLERYVYMNLNKDFQICISILLIKFISKFCILVHENSQAISISLHFP